MIHKISSNSKILILIFPFFEPIIFRSLPLLTKVYNSPPSFSSQKQSSYPWFLFFPHLLYLIYHQVLSVLLPNFLNLSVPIYYHLFHLDYCRSSKRFPYFYWPVTLCCLHSNQSSLFRTQIIGLVCCSKPPPMAFLALGLKSCVSWPLPAFPSSCNITLFLAH